MIRISPMLQTLFYFFLLCVPISKLYAQISNQDTSQYSNAEKEKFVHIYMSHKNVGTGNEIKSLGFPSDLSDARMKEIWKALKTNKLEYLSDEELNFLENIKQKLITDKETLSKSLKKYCIDENLSIDKYQSMLMLYQSNLHFQQSLRPYFTEFLHKRAIHE